MSRIKDGRSVVVYDTTGAIFDVLRNCADDLRFQRANDGVTEPRADGDLAVIASYERTDWTMAARLAEELPTVVVSATFDNKRATRALSFGLTGFLDARLPATALARALRGALEGEPAYPRAVLGHYIRDQRATPARIAPRKPLTRRQVEVLALVGRGAADKEIAGALGISTATAQKHVANILERLGVPNRAAAVAALWSAYGETWQS